MIRGDGEVGENVMVNVKMIVDILYLVMGVFDVLEVWGEVYMFYVDFEVLNVC